MKKSLSLLLIFALFCALLAGCAQATDDPCLADGSDESDGAGTLSVEEPAATMRCRVVTADGDNSLLVASVDSDYSDIYSLSLNGAELRMRQGDGTEVSSAEANITAPSVGAMVEVGFNGEIMETYPARFGGVTRITVLPDEFDDRCALYLTILEELWNEDDGLNADITCVSVDLSATSLAPAERSAVAWAFAQSHGVESLEYSYDELVENGYIDGVEATEYSYASLLVLENGNITGADLAQDGLPRWEDGVLFTLTEEDDVFFNLPMNAKGAVSLRAEKWRSALGAYGFTVTATQDADGAWGKPTIGAGWIS